MIYLFTYILELIRKGSWKPSPEGKKKLKWQRVGDESERRALLFGSGFSTLAGMKGKKKRLNQQAKSAILRSQKSYPPIKIICIKNKCIFQREYVCQVNNTWQQLSFALQGNTLHQYVCRWQNCVISFGSLNQFVQQNRCHF